jgi:hypothetical protein
MTKCEKKVKFVGDKVAVGLPQRSRKLMIEDKR